MTKQTEQTKLEAAAPRFKLDQMGRAFATDLAIAELERRVALLEDAETRLFESVTATCKRAGNIER